MDVKKIGIWAGGFIGSFIVILGLVYLLFPYLNPEKAASVEKKKPEIQQISYDPSKYSLDRVDSLNHEISTQQVLIDSLMRSDSLKQQMIDSLRQQLEKQPEQKFAKQVSAIESEDIQAIKEASKPLLKLDEEALAPIVDLLDEDQLIMLYRKGSGREREKLLRTLKPQKAAQILKKVM